MDLSLIINFFKDIDSDHYRTRFNIENLGGNPTRSQRYNYHLNLKKKKKGTRGKLRPGEECCPWLWVKKFSANKNVPEKKIEILQNEKDRKCSLYYPPSLSEC